MKKYLCLITTLLLSCQGSAAGKNTSQPAPSTSKKTNATAEAPVQMSATKVLKYADSGVGSPYVWGGSRWSTDDRDILGADCSGFTQKAWGYPRLLKTEQALPSSNRLTTAEFIKAQDRGYPWTRLDNVPYSQARPGDAMVYRSDGSGHIFIVSKLDSSGVVTLEARGRKYGIGYARKSFAYLRNMGYTTLRHN